MGLAEQRLGRGLTGIDRQDVVVSTKVGRLLRADAPADPDMFHDGDPFFKDTPALNPVWDFSYRGTMLSLEESLARLHLARVDIALLHEPPEDRLAEAGREAFRALLELKSAGKVGAIGVGWDRVELMVQLVDELEMDCILLANRYSLLDQTAARRLLPLCDRRRVSIIVGGVFNSGILASSTPSATYDYLPADEAIRSRVETVSRMCESWSIPMRAAALQFPLAHPSVAGVVVGMRSAAELADNIEMLNVEIPGGLWSALKRAGILPSDAATPQAV
jgi:D-threo-aldose 1-dehydrogenase